MLSKARRTESRRREKISQTMREFKAGTLHSGSAHGPKVTNPKQAIAISLNQARKKG